MGLIIVLYGWTIQNKSGPYYDDVYTQFTVSGCGLKILHDIDTLQTERPINSTVIAQIFEKNEAFNYGAVSEKILYSDSHPPLYFWAAHTWKSIFGFSTTSYLWMNGCIILCLGWVWCKLLRSLQLGAYWGFWLGLAMLSHPIVLEAFITHRHYALLGLIVVVFIYVEKAYPHRLGPYFLAQGATVVCGMLTHYLFAIFLASFWILRLLTGQKEKDHYIKLAFIALMCVSTIGLFFPFFRNLFYNEGYDYASSALFDALAVLPLRFVLPYKILALAPNPLWLAGIWLLPLFFAFHLISNLKSWLAFFALQGVVILFIEALLFLLMKLPLHSITTQERYLVIMYPLLLLGLPQLFEASTKLKRASKILVPALVLGMGVQSALHGRPMPQRSIETERVYLVKGAYPELYQLALVLDADQSIFLVDNPLQLSKEELSGATLLWPRPAKKALEAWTARSWVPGKPQRFVHPGWCFR